MVMLCVLCVCVRCVCVLCVCVYVCYVCACFVCVCVCLHVPDALYLVVYMHVGTTLNLYIHMCMHVHVCTMKKYMCVRGCTCK